MTRLSQIDAFFVAYQERAGIPMQLGVEAELKGFVYRSDLERMLQYLTGRWPQLGQRLHRRVLGLAWNGVYRTEDMLSVSHAPDALIAWRNTPIDPFCEPPFQMLWIPDEGKGLLAFRAHHAVADGESFIFICVEGMRMLAHLKGGKPALHDQPAAQVRPPNLISLWRQGKLKKMWRYTRWLAKEAQAGRSARLCMRACMPGDIAVCERVLNGASYERLKQKAVGVSPLWLSAAAWIRTIHAWNVLQRNASNSLMSLEVPVSMRRGAKTQSLAGNFISPLVLFADASQKLEAIAYSLKQQFLAGIRQQLYLGMPIFTALGRYLPWSLFRRLAVNTASTGFATSHFTWLEQKKDVHAEILASSNGALQVVHQRSYTPVCLHMGAALAVLAWPERAQFFITYRETALSQAEAEELIDLVMAELTQATLTLQKEMA